MSIIIRRGFNVDDPKWFSDESVKKLRVAAEEIEWLINKSYKTDPVLDFVADHYQLSARQRIALLRATASQQQVRDRKNKLLPLSSLKENEIYIDGFNIIINLEVALSGSASILGRDGVIRDLAGLRGTYRVIDKTDRALELLGLTLKELQAPSVKFLLDAPVSNSGRFKSKIFEHAGNWKFPIDVELVPNPDVILSKCGRVVTGDSVILDNCISWFNLLRFIIEDKLKDAWIIDLEGV